jgi:alpha-L-fucosidase
MRKTANRVCLFIALFLLALATGKGDEPYQASWESLQRHTAAPEWFRDAKFGIYFHWGVYSVPAFDSEWYPRNMHRKESRAHKHHVERYGDPAKFGYHDFVPMFKAEHFDPEEWAELFEKAGARFAGLVAEHHDGFAMWASKLTPWNAKDRGPKRDITGELAKALRKRGLKLVTTFHHARNHQHMINANDPRMRAQSYLDEKGGLQWAGHYPHIEGWPPTSRDPELRLLYGNIPRMQFLELWKGKLLEVIDKYHPDLIWFDSWLHEIPDLYKMEFLAHYFNQAEEQNQEVVVTFKQQDLPREVAIDDFEKGRADSLTGHAWLTDDTISDGSWCYTEDLRIKSTKTVLHSLIDIVSKNGQLLLNISPKADGTIPDNQRKVLLELGAWLEKYGEAIYETRPWTVFGEGPTRLEKGGQFIREVEYSPQDIRYTRKGQTIYAIFLGWPGAGKEVVLGSFDPSKVKGLKVNSVSLLGSDAEVRFVQEKAGLKLSLPEQSPDQTAVVFKIATSK